MYIYLLFYEFLILELYITMYLFYFTFLIYCKAHLIIYIREFARYKQ